MTFAAVTWHPRVPRLAWLLALASASGIGACGDGLSAPVTRRIEIQNGYADSAALLVLTQAHYTLVDLNPSPVNLAVYAPLIAASGGRIRVPIDSIAGYTPSAELVFVVYAKRSGRVILPQVIRLSARELTRRDFRFGIADAPGAQ
jgi:hypothetical protein